MSRSYRKPYWVEGYGSPDKKKRKRSASKAVRREQDIAGGNAYKKVYQSWDICDYKFYEPNSDKAKRK